MSVILLFVLFSLVCMSAAFFIGSPTRPVIRTAVGDRIFFDVHNDSTCSFLDWRHGVELGVCQTEKEFLRLWNAFHHRDNTSDADYGDVAANDAFEAISFRVVIPPPANETNGANETTVSPSPSSFQLERFFDNNCSSSSLLSTEDIPTSTLDECHSSMRLRVSLAQPLPLDGFSNGQFYGEHSFLSPQDDVCSFRLAKSNNFTLYALNKCISTDGVTSTYFLCGDLGTPLVFHSSPNCTGESEFLTYPFCEWTNETMVAQKFLCSAFSQQNAFWETSFPTVEPTAFPSRRAYSLLQTTVSFSLSDVFGSAAVNDSSFHREFERVVCKTLGIATSYCRCNEQCLSLALASAPSTTATNEETMLRRSTLQQDIVLYRLTAAVNVTLNAVDFSQPQNESVVFAQAAELISNMTTTVHWESFYWKELAPRSDIFYVPTQIIDMPEMAWLGVVAPPLHGAQEVMSVAPTLSPTGTLRKGPKTLSDTQKIGIGVSLSMLAVFQFLALYFCFFQDDSGKLTNRCFPCFNNAVYVSDSPS